MNLLTYVFAFAIFACVGSFIGVCADRIPRGEQILKGRSRCDSCGKTLGALELIPIVSYLFLGGKCRHCKARIPFQSTAIELLAAALGTLSIFLFGPTVQGIAYGIVTCVLIEVAVLDFKTMEISDVASILIALVGIVLMIYHGTYMETDSVWLSPMYTQEETFHMMRVLESIITLSDPEGDKVQDENTDAPTDKVSA